MAQQTIDIGASPNDGTGDPIRTAFDKTNQNFTELYGVIGSNAIANAVLGLTANNTNFVGSIPAANVVDTSMLTRRKGICDFQPKRLTNRTVRLHGT